ncbi:MAG: hypothetical protein IPK48_08715 [Gammaproteobacteria bacterium]|nr:hypothetical protein [Gammaproteobacteria bacterium]
MIDIGAQNDIAKYNDYLQKVEKAKAKAPTKGSTSSSTAPGKAASTFKPRPTSRSSRKEG